MGNNGSKDTLATAAVAKYMKITKHQVIQLLASCQRLSTNSSRTAFQRNQFEEALDQAQISIKRDREILTLLCTMWDITGSGLIPSLEFGVSLSPLACPGESISTVLSFALQLVDQAGTGLISDKQTVLVLKSISATASYFGDTVLGLRQVYKIVDNVFETIAFVDASAGTLSHKETVQRLVSQPAIRQVMTREGQYHSKLMRRLRVNTMCSASESQLHSHAEDQETVSAFTDVSSVLLSPVVEIPIKSFAESEITRTTGGGTSTTNSSSIRLSARTRVSVSSRSSKSK